MISGFYAYFDESMKTMSLSNLKIDLFTQDLTHQNQFTTQVRPIEVIKFDYPTIA